MARPLIGQRSAEFTATAQEVCKQLQQLFRTTRSAAFENAPATALMGAAFRKRVEKSE